MRSLLSICLFAIFTYSCALSEDCEFLVIALNGEASVLREFEKSYKPILTGHELFKEDNFRLSNDSYLSLLHKSGKIFSINEPGEYNTSKISNSLNGDTRSIIFKIAKRMINNFNKCKILETKDTFNEKLISGLDSSLISDEKYSQFYFKGPAYTRTLNDEILIDWFANENSGPFQIRLSDRFGNIIKEWQQDSTLTFISRRTDSLILNNIYIINVKNLSDKDLSLNLAIEFTSRDLIKDIELEINQLRVLLGKSEFMTYVILAQYYEMKQLHGMATHQYRRALSLDSSDLSIKYFRCFKERNNFE